jgi:hypothetical protein
MHFIDLKLKGSARTGVAFKYPLRQSELIVSETMVRLKDSGATLLCNLSLIMLR